MFIGKIDGQLNANNRVSARWSQFKNKTPENGGSGLNTREVAPDFQDKMDSIGLQLISTIGNNKLNELRFTYGKRDNPRVFSEPSLASPLQFRVNVSGVANFGKATNAPTTFIEDFFQIIDNFSVIKGNHNIKLGIDFQFINDERLNSLVPTWTFPSQAAYIAARDGVDPFSYTRLDSTDRYPGRSVQAEVLLVLHSGRLAGEPEAEGPLRPALRPRPAAGWQPIGSGNRDAGLPPRRQQLRTAGRSRVEPRR